MVSETLFFTDTLALPSEKKANYRHASDNIHDNSGKLKVTSLSKGTPLKSAVKDLPSIKSSLQYEATSLGLLGKNATFDEPRAKLIAYIHDSEKIKRCFNHVSLLLVGSSGVGKSSTINHLLNFSGEESVKTSSIKSETRITSEFLAFADDPDLEVKNLVLGVVDTPGFNDTDGVKQDACNFYSIKRFYDGHPKLRGCYPNLILVVVPATDTRVAGKNSNLSKSLKCLNELSLVDHRRPNVVAVLSFCCSVSSKKVEVWKEQMEEKKKVVQDVIFDALKVNAPVVLLENNFEDEELEKDGDFTKLPNGELQPKNLYDACEKVLRKNEDNLGLVTFNACFLNVKKNRIDGHKITAKDASKDALNKEEEEFVNYFEQAARGGT